MFLFLDLLQRMHFFLGESIGQYQRGVGVGGVVLVMAGIFRPKLGLFEIPGSLCRRWTSRINPSERILSGPFRGSVSHFFPGLQDSRAKMQDSKDIFPSQILIFTSGNAIFPMGECRTVPAADREGGCVWVVALILDHKQSQFQIPIDLRRGRYCLISPYECILSGPNKGSVSPLFPSLQDSREEMQDSKGIFRFIVWFSRRRMRFFP